MSNGMNKVPVEACCEILDSQRIPITASARSKGQYPYYGANGIQDYVDDYIFDDELVLLAEDGGNFGSKDRPIAYRVSGKCWVNNHAHVLKPKHGLDVDYLCYALMFYDVTGLVNGATRMKLTQAAMRQMLIPLPEFSEQLRIVNYLSTIQEIMRKRQQQLSALDDLIKARFVEMTEESDTVPTRMGDVATYINGYAFKPTDWEDNGLPIIRIQNLNDSKAIYNHYSGLIDGKYRVRSGDVLVSWATHLEAYIWRGGDAWLNQHIFRVIFDKMPINKTYFVYSTEAALKQAFRNAHGFKPTMEHIKRSDFENTVVNLPPLDVQERFAQFVSQIDKSKSAIQKSLDETQILFDSLMQKYYG